MKVDIWSDVRCPFCYIGKRKFEKALDKFSHKNEVEVNWHSFELDPNITTNPALNAVDHLAKIKGISKGQAEGMETHVRNVASEIGLDFGNSVVANSFNAHRLIQLAKTKKLANDVEEELFKANFIDGKNIDDKDVLAEIGVSIGMNKDDVNKVLESDDFAQEVRQDEAQAQSIGINGVPFFILNNKYAVSGAQSPDTFLDTLEQTWEEFEKEKKLLTIIEGESCSTNGNCN